MRPMSLALRLFLSVLAINLLTMLAVAVIGLKSANSKIAEEYDAQLITEASVLWQVVHKDVLEGDFREYDIGGETPLLEKMEIESLLKYAQWRAFRVWYKGKPVIYSDNTDDMPAKFFPPGFSEFTTAGETWRLFSLHVPQEHIVVETFENLHNRELLQRDILFGVAEPIILILPLLGLLFSFAIGFCLRALRLLTRRLSARSPADLSRLKSEDIPPELQPLAQAVNALLAKLESSLAHEREFIDHAAHELRTPLSALKLQAQLLVDSLKSLESEMALKELLASVDRTSRLVDQLLLLSRMAQQTIVLEPVNLTESAKEAIGMYALRVVDKRINLTFHGNEILQVQAQPELLRTLIGNIIDNAIKYTPGGGEITVITAHVDGHAQLTVTDSGAGIPETERVRVFDRFYRVPDTRQAGSGLGLAIANQIAQLLKADITLDTPPTGKGLRVTIIFP